ncbi:MAG: hypothetical protein R2774_05090 [Saprospiraceae bacterium]
MPSFKYVLACCIGLLVFAASCQVKKHETVHFDRDKIVHFLVDFYTIQSASALSDKSKQDSLYREYAEKYAIQHNISLNEIQKELKNLEFYPDSLIVFQNMALDTLRMIQEEIIRNNELKEKELQ